MARPLRIDVPGGFYHVVARGWERRRLFADDTDRLHWLDRLGELPSRFGVRVHGYVLMGNHVHLLLKQKGQVSTSDNLLDGFVSGRQSVGNLSTAYAC